MRIQPDNETDTLVVTWTCGIVKRVPVFPSLDVSKRGSGVRGTSEHVAAEGDAHRMPRKPGEDPRCLACYMDQNVVVDGPYLPEFTSADRPVSLRGVTDVTSQFALIGL